VLISPNHVESARQHCKLKNQYRSERDGKGEKRLREADGKGFVCHVLSPLSESIER